MPDDPYRIEGPALISFSGGRTSGFMLHQILQAHGGTLPDNVHVAFANTGKEREETLRFVHECGIRWNVPIHWIEWRPGELGFEQVGYNSASRNGEPFAALIRERGFVPNQRTRFCSIVLKVRAARNFAVNGLGWKNWTSYVGLRHDEGIRVLKALDRNAANKDRFKAAMPMAKAKHTKRDVLAFWSAQPFDLGLRDYEGNCDLCFLKRRGKLERIMREGPDRAAWWIEQERIASCTADVPGGAQFRLGEPYAEIARHVAASPPLPNVFDDDEHDAECGLLCAAEAA
jgi:3'-phosphoadenosine 5'-phosphosulfate sulfotransferase (PAPS reductase)/FAD synthetase